MTKYISTPLVSDLDTVLNKYNYDLVYTDKEYHLIDKNFIIIFRSDSLMGIYLYLQEHLDA